MTETTDTMILFLLIEFGKQQENES